MKINFTNTAKTICFLTLATAFYGCKKDKNAPDTAPAEIKSRGLYVLNEGNFGMNKASLDFLDLASGSYTKNIFASANPTVAFGLGDSGNDVKVYGSKVYVVVNGSNKVEVLNQTTSKEVAKLDIANPRFITFYKNLAYITSYDGFVAAIDTAAATVIKTKIKVGNQPEEMAIVGTKLYVANSGGYNAPNYDRTVSVIDLNTNTEIKKIDVALNLYHLKADKYGDVYVSSRGDYANVPSSLFLIDTKTDAVTKDFKIPTGDFCIEGDNAFVFSYDYAAKKGNYLKLNIKDESVVTNNFIADDTGASITTPYGITVDASSGDIYIADASGYTAPGKLYAFDSSGKKKSGFPIITGDLPGHFAFLYK